MARNTDLDGMPATECARLTSAGTSADVRRWQRYLSAETPCPVEELAKLAVAADAGPIKVLGWVHELARRRRGDSEIAGGHDEAAGDHPDDERDPADERDG